MKTIKGAIELPELPVLGLEHVRDLLYVDGPILSQFSHPRGSQYLYYWCDADESGHRWMVLRVAETKIVQLRYRFVPLHLVIPVECLDDYVYFVDTDGDGVRSVVQVSLDKIPNDYIPESGCFIDDDSEEDDLYAVLLDSSETEVFKIPRIFEVMYSFRYATDVMGVDEMAKFPWHGGFSSASFNSWIKNTIPKEGRLTVDKMTVSSPGFASFRLNGGVASTIEADVYRFNLHREEIKTAQAFLQDYLKAHYEDYSDDADKTGYAEFDEELEKRATLLTTRMQSISWEKLKSMTTSTFEAAQILRWYFRRTQDVAKEVVSGTVRLRPSTDDTVTTA